jgi:hypothetical protein
VLAGAGLGPAMPADRLVPEPAPIEPR